VLAAALLTGLLALAGGAASAQAARTVATTEVRGIITPIVADHLADATADAGRAGHEALVVLLDTPGGLVTSMREIVQTFLNAPLPVIVYVSPAGADAGSAGTFITLSAHVAAMAPATTIGAATPVDLEGGEVGDKIVNNAAAFAETIAEERDRDVTFAVDAVREGRSVTATEALEIGAIDLVTESVADLLDEIDGSVVEVGVDEVTLATAGATLVPFEMSWTRRLLQRLADPNLAFVFISIGTLAIIYEVANPGMGAGGIIGGVMLVLAFTSLSVLPVSLAGVLLLVLAFGLFVAELFAPGVGVGAAGGTVALVLGGILLFQRPTGIGVDLWVLLPTAAVLAGLVALVGRTVVSSRHRDVTDITHELVGREARVHLADDGTPRVRLDGTSWRVRPDPDGAPDLADGEQVEVVRQDNLDLVVRRPGSRTAPSP
jgi:membrane-bound serine protease (ClpP class)